MRLNNFLKKIYQNKRATAILIAALVTIILIASAILFGKSHESGVNASIKEKIYEPIEFKSIKEESPVSTKANGKLSVIKLKDYSTLSLNPLISTYLNTNMMKFKERSKDISGIWVDYYYSFNGSFEPYVESSEDKKHHAYLNILRFKKGYQNNIISNIEVGDGYGKIISILGNPSFKDKGTNLLGFKTKDYYLIIKGKSTAEEISIIKAPKPTPRDLKVAEYYSSKFPIKYYELFQGYRNYKQVFPARCDYPVRFLFGISFDQFEKAIISYYNNFEGEYIKPNKNFNVKFINEDTVFDNEINYYQNLKDSNSEGQLISPDNKNILSLYNGGLYEESRVIIKSAVDDKPPVVIYPGYFIDKTIWLSNDEVLIIYGNTSDQYLIYSLITEKLKKADYESLDSDLKVMENQRKAEQKFRSAFNFN